MKVYIIHSIDKYCPENNSSGLCIEGIASSRSIADKVISILNDQSDWREYMHYEKEVDEFFINYKKQIITE